MPLASTSVIGALLAGCAATGGGAITGGAAPNTQIITVKTPTVRGATCTLSSLGMGKKTVVTPGTVVVPQQQDTIAVQCSKECFEDGTALVGTSLFGGYAPEVQVPMQPLKNCKPRA